MSKSNKILDSGWLLPVLIVCLVVLLVSVLAQFSRYKNYSVEIEKSKTRVAELKSQIGNEEGKNPGLLSDEELELLAKRKLNYRNPGEKVVFVYSNGENDVISTGASQESIKYDVIEGNKDRLVTWWQYLFGK